MNEAAYVRQLEARIKSRDIRVALGPKTLILGKSDSGKGARVNALELAVQGGASDLMYRRWVKAGDMIRSMLDDPYCVATWSDNRVSTYTKGKQSGPKGSSVEDLLEGLIGSPDAAVAKLLDLCLRHAPPSEILTRLGFADQKALLTAIKETESLESEQQRELEKAKSSLSALRQGPGDVEAARTKFSKACRVAKATEEEVRNWSPYGSQAPRLSKDELEEAIAEAKAKLEAAKKAALIDLRARSLKVVLEWSQKAGDCVVCGGDDVMPLAEFEASYAGGIAASRHALEAAVTAAEQVLARLERQAGKADVKDLGKAWQAWEALQAAELQAARHLAAEAAQSEIPFREEQLAATRQTLKTYRDAKAELFKEVHQAYVNRVNAHLPEGWRLELDTDNRRTTFGIRIQGVLVSAPSGRQLNWLLGAMLSGLPVEEGRCRLLILPDRGYSPKALQEMLEGLARSPHQVIVQSTVRPSKLPEGWTLVDVEEADTEATYPLVAVAAPAWVPRTAPTAALPSKEATPGASAGQLAAAPKYQQDAWMYRKLPDRVVAVHTSDYNKPAFVWEEAR